MLSLWEDWPKKNEMIYNNCESHKWVQQNIPNECLWHEGRSVWGYVSVQLVQSSCNIGCLL